MKVGRCRQQSIVAQHANAYSPLVQPTLGTERVPSDYPRRMIHTTNYQPNTAYTEQHAFDDTNTLPEFLCEICGRLTHHHCSVCGMSVCRVNRGARTQCICCEPEIGYVHRTDEPEVINADDVDAAVCEWCNGPRAAQPCHTCVTPICPQCRQQDYTCPCISGDACPSMRRSLPEKQIPARAADHADIVWKHIQEFGETDSLTVQLEGLQQIMTTRYHLNKRQESQKTTIISETNGMTTTTIKVETKNMPTPNYNRTKLGASLPETPVYGIPTYKFQLDDVPSGESTRDNEQVEMQHKPDAKTRNEDYLISANGNTEADDTTHHLATSNRFTLIIGRPIDKVQISTDDSKQDMVIASAGTHWQSNAKTPLAASSTTT